MLGFFRRCSPAQHAMLALLLTIPAILSGVNSQLLNATCSNDSYAGGSAFSRNLDALFATLRSTASSSNFHNATAGDGPDRAYGLFACQGDLSAWECRDCVGAATANASGASGSCPGRARSRRATLWFEYCLLRYSDGDFFGVVDHVGEFSMKNPFASAPDPARPLEVLAQLAKEAPRRPPLMFATNRSEADDVYALAQCTGDLRPGDCAACLSSILEGAEACCSRARGYRYLAPSCWIRYEADPKFLDRGSTASNVELFETRCPGGTFQNSSSKAEEAITAANLGRLLSLLSSNISSTGFANLTVGRGSSALYGLVLCRGDLPGDSEGCRECLVKARNKASLYCRNKTEATVWYERCLLRYSAHDFFGTVDAGQHYCAEQGTSEDDDRAVLRMMARLADGAPNTSSMFAAGEERIGRSSMPTAYGLVQCTRDVGADGCRRCLDMGIRAVSTYCKRKGGWRYWSGSCTLRFETGPFFDTSIIGTGTPATQPDRTEDGKKLKGTIIIVIASSLTAVLSMFILYYLWKRRADDDENPHFNDLDPPTEMRLGLVEMATIREATNNFCEENKLGQGGFGPVYKGTLPGGEEVAIKRLSTRSKQGSEEFKNEAMLIARLQHRNLVRILGYCIEGEEKLLVYEYMPNKSLDTFLFDPGKSCQLDWNTRFNIISGIARGLLYLHEDSQLKIVHRDMKTSNVLLNQDMNPKISDFGMARIFKDDESEANTQRVVGTLGYMAPEYIRDGVFSVKSDVFSFGVILLEIVSGQRNGHQYLVDHEQSLLMHAWQLWREDKVLEFINPLVVDSSPLHQVLRCFHTGMLCVQENAEKRPNMLSILFMLQNEQMVLPEPSNPPTFTQRGFSISDQSSSTAKTLSINEVTITQIGPR